MDHGEARLGSRKAISNLVGHIVTPEVSKHRIFVWVNKGVLPDHKPHVFARDDDYYFGVLHSIRHESWTIATCSWIGKGNDPSYNSDSTFMTFPFPLVPRTRTLRIGRYWRSSPTPPANLFACAITGSTRLVPT